MRTTYKFGRRGGHSPGHVRDTFIDAVEAYRGWNDDEPEPEVEFEVNYVPRKIPISRACGLVWNCSDILASTDVSRLEWCGIELQRRTYAAAARALHAQIQSDLARQSAGKVAA